MEKKLYDEMVENVDIVDEEIKLADKKIFLFGHCNATLELIDLLESKGLQTTGILDNSDVKQGQISHKQGDDHEYRIKYQKNDQDPGQQNGIFHALRPSFLYLFSVFLFSSISSS